MEGYSVKVYLVIAADRDGNLGEVLAAKLTYTAAQKVAMRHAPAKILFAEADKGPERNVSDYYAADKQKFPTAFKP